MKIRTSQRVSASLLVLAATMNFANAATYYWDSNGTSTTGAGATPTGTWGADVFWNTSPTGDAGTITALTTALDDVFFSAGTDAVNPYTVTLNGTQNARLVTFEDGTVTLSGGTLNLGAGGGITVTTNTVTGSTISSGLTITGRQTFNVAAGRTLTLDTGTFTRNAGATLDISGTVTSTMTNLSANDATGIIGNWAFFGNSYANFTGSTITALGYTGGADGTSVAASTSVVTGAGGLNYKLTAGIGTLGLNASVNTLQVSAGGTLANNGTFTTNGIYNTSGAGLTFSGPITIGSSNELVVNTNGGGIIFSGAIGGAAGASFTKLGGQNLTFNGANSYTGATNVNVGTLTIGAGGSINAASAINIQSGATLATSINNSFSGSPTGAWTVAGTITGTANAQTIPTSVTLNNGTMSGTLFASFGTFLTQSVGATITANGNSNTISAGNFGLGGTGILTLSTPLATDTLNFSSVIGATSANAGGLSKSGLGALTLSAASTYTGGTTMSAGTININSVGAAGNGPLGNGGTFVINGGAIDNTSGSAKVVVNVNPITLGGNFAFSTSAGTANNNLTLPGAITMAADRTFTLNGAGALTLSGLLTNTADSVRTLTVNNGAGTTAASLLTIGSYNLTGAGSTAARNNIINGTGNVTISGVVGNGISAGSGLTYNGIGVLTLGGANTFTGQLTVATGTLSIASINNVSANGTLGNSDMNLPVILGSSGGNTGTLRYTAASGSSDKAFTLAAGGTGAFDVTTALTLIGLIDGSGNLTKTGAGNLTLGQTFTNTGIGLAPQFTGVTTIINGKIILTQAQTSGSNNALNGSLLGLQKSVYDTTGSSASLDVTTLGAANGVLWLGGLQGSSVNLATAVSGYNRIAYLNLSPQTGTSASYGAVIADGAAGMIVDKLGPGTQTLTGINSYSGATVIYAGTLGLGSATNAGGSLLNSAVTVRGGTLLLDNSFGWTNRIADTLAPSALSLGSLTLKSYNGAGAQTETVGATTFAVGGKVTINNGSTVGDQTTFAMGTVTRSAGAAIDFVGTNGTLGAGANSPNVTTSGTFPGGSNGILPWATVGGTSWAGTASTTNIVAYAGAFVDPTSAASNAADNARLTGSGTMNAVKSFNSLNVISNLAGQSLDLSTAGVLTLTSGAILKSGTNAYTISGSAASAITAGTELIAHVDGGALTISAPLNTAIVNLAKGGTGALVLSGTRAANFTGSVGITGTLEFQGASTTLSGLVTGPGNLTVNLNAGQTLLINNGANTFSGNILVKGGILADGSFDAGLSVAPGVGNTTVGAVGNPNKSAGSMNNIELNGGILAANYAFGRFLGAAPDQFQITGGVSGISTNNGTFTIGGSTNYEAVWGSIYFQPTTLVLNDAVAGASAVLTWGNKLDLNGATRTIATNSAAFGATLSGVIRDTVGGAGLTKIGVGSLTLSGANSFNGGLLIQNGTLSATTSTSALGGTTGAGAVTLGSSTFGNGATLNIDGRNFTNPITLGSGATGTLTLGNSATAAIYSGGVSGSNGFTINNSGGSNTLTFQAGNITSSGLITNLGTSTGATTISSNITSANTAGLIQNSSGSLVLSGTNNYSGPTTITQGTLQFTKLASLYNNTAASWIPTNLNVVLGATLALNVGGSGEFATTDLVTFLDGSHMGLSTPTTGFKSGSALGLDTTNAGGTFTPTAFIGNPGTSTLLGLTKLGTGTLILNLANTYTGATTISNGGTLQIGSGSAAGSIANTSGVLNNGTLTFNRTDSYGGNFTPLISGTGAVTVSAGALILTAANTFSGATTVNGVGTTLTLTNSLALQNSALVTTGTGTVILSSVTTPTFGGLSGATGNLASVISSGYSGITSLTLNPAGSVTYGGVIADGAAGMTLTKTGAGTQILQGANSYSGATNFNAGTVNLTGNGHINTSTGLNFNGGSLLVTTTTVGEAAINRVNDTAAIISTGGGTITVTNTPSGTTVYSETMGALDLRGGQLNIVSTNANTTPAETLSFGSGSLTTINGSARAITDTSAITFSGGSLGASAKNSIIVTGQATTANNEIIGAWATFGATAALQTDYATYNITAGSTNAFGIQGAGIGATTSDAAWSTTLATTSNYNFANGTTGTTLTSTKNINSLRHTGSAETLTVATGANLGTYGILNGVSSLLTIAATGTGVVTLPTTTAGSLFVNAGSGGVTISAPITNNTGALTLVKDGSLILTLGAAANVNTYSGGTVINAGTVTSSASGLTNFLGSGTVTVNSGATLTVNGCSIANAITSNGGAFNISNGFASGFTGTSFVLGTGTTSTLDTGTTGSAAISNNVSGAGGLTKIGNSAVAVKLNGTNSYTGVTTISAGILQFKSSLYNNNTALWTPANIIVANTGTLMLNVGGASDFTTAQAGTLFGNLTTVNNNGLLSGSAVGFDTTNATSVVTYSTVLANSTGGGGGAVGLKKYGSGTLVLTGANTYSGPTIVEGGGTLKVSSFNSVNGGIPLLASSSLGAPTTVANGTITIGAATFIGGSIIYTGTGETTDRVINLAGQNATLVLDQSGTGLLKFTSALTIAAGNTKVITLQGSTGGTGELAAGIPMQGATQVLNKNGTGTWTLSGANLYTGLNTISGGTLAGTQNSGTPFGLGAVSLSAVTLSLAPSGSGSAVSLTGGTVAAATAFTFNADATLSLARGSQTSLTYTFGGTGTTWTRGTNGTLILSTSDIANFGTLGSKTERFIINGTAPATVNTVVSGVIGQDRNTSNAGDFLNYDATDGFTKSTYSAADFTGSTASSVLNIASASTSGATLAYALRVSGTVSGNNTITLGSNGNPTAGIILNGGTIGASANDGILTTVTSSATEFAVYVSSLNGTINSSINTATSQTGLSVFGPGALTLGATTNTFTGGLRINNTTVIATGDTQLGGTTNPITLTGGTLQTSGTFGLGGAGQRAITLGAGQGNTGGTFNVTSGTTTYQNASSGSKILSGTGSLTKTGAGTMVLSGNTTNTYTGGTFVSNGTLQLGASNMLADTGLVTVNGGTFDIQGNSDNVGAVTLTSGSINGSGGTLTGTSYDVRSGSASAILGGSGVALTKTTSGTVTLSATNTYTGATTVSTGLLIVNGSIATSSLTTVASGATIGGSGMIGALTVSSGGSINPGNSPGILSVTGNYTQAGTYNAEITGTTPGTQYDQINVTGTVDITGGSLVTMFSGSYSANDLIFILLNDNTDVITGTYAGLADGATVTSYGGFNWNISYFADSGLSSFTGGNDIALQAVLIPEPKTALLGVLGALLILRRRR